MANRMEIISPFTPLADFSVRIKPAIRTDRAEVMDTLHCGDSQRMQEMIDGRRNKGIDIVDVGDIRSPFCDSLVDFTARPEGVYRIKRKPQFLRGPEGPDLVVMPGVEKNFMPVALQKFPLGKSDCVFASELLIEI